MEIKKINLKSCCNSKAVILESSLVIKKSYLDTFKSQGFTAPDSFFKSGVFYVQKANFVATCSYGSNRIHVRCSGPNCDSQIEAFQVILRTLS